MSTDEFEKQTAHRLEKNPVEQPTLVRPDLQKLDEQPTMQRPDPMSDTVNLSSLAPTAEPTMVRPPEAQRTMVKDPHAAATMMPSGNGRHAPGMDDATIVPGFAGATATAGAMETTITMRFGPGVPRDPAAIALLENPPAKRRRRRRIIRWVAFVALLLALAFLLWWMFLRSTSGARVEGIQVTGPSSTLACNTTAEVAAILQTNGKEGEITYRWVRNDGNASEPQKQQVVKDQRETTVHLRWTFEGIGRFDGVATIEVLEPNSASAQASFTYDCR